VNVMKYFRAAIVAMIVGNVLDGVTTYIALGCGLRELNPVLYHWLGWVIKFFVPLFGFLFIYVVAGKRYAAISGFVYAVVFGAAAINNTLQLLIHNCL